MKLAGCLLFVVACRAASSTSDAPRASADSATASSPPSVPASAAAPAGSVASGAARDAATDARTTREDREAARLARQAQLSRDIQRDLEEIERHSMTPLGALADAGPKSIFLVDDPRARALTQPGDGGGAAGMSGGGAAGLSPLRP